MIGIPSFSTPVQFSVLTYNLVFWKLFYLTFRQVSPQHWGFTVHLTLCSKNHYTYCIHTIHISIHTIHDKPYLCLYLFTPYMTSHTYTYIYTHHTWQAIPMPISIPTSIHTIHDKPFLYLYIYTPYMTNYTYIYTHHT